MQLRKLAKEDDAVSPVIGVILMVAITVILAAVIASFVLGLGDQADEVQPNSNFEFEFESNDQAPNNLTISLTDGDSIQSENLHIRGEFDGEGVDLNWTNDGVFEDFQDDSGLAVTPSQFEGYYVQGSGGFDADSEEIVSGQGIELNGTSDSGSNSLSEYEIDVVWDTGDDSSTLGSDEGSE